MPTHTHIKSNMSEVTFELFWGIGYKNIWLYTCVGMGVLIPK